MLVNLNINAKFYSCLNQPSPYKMITAMQNNKTLSCYDVNRLPSPPKPNLIIPQLGEQYSLRHGSNKLIASVSDDTSTMTRILRRLHTHSIVITCFRSASSSFSLGCTHSIVITCLRSASSSFSSYYRI